MKHGPPSVIEISHLQRNRPSDRLRALDFEIEPPSIGFKADPGSEPIVIRTDPGKAVPVAAVNGAIEGYSINADALATRFPRRSGGSRSMHTDGCNDRDKPRGHPCALLDRFHSEAINWRNVSPPPWLAPAGCR
ncbi:MAG: hypothetical protein WC429_20720, partial [Verrucomicrobiia bacterium]